MATSRKSGFSSAHAMSYGYEAKLEALRSKKLKEVEEKDETLKDKIPERLFYTVDELAEHCRRAVYDFYMSQYTGELTKHFIGTNINILNFSSNSIAMSYYDHRIQFYYKYSPLTDSMKLTGAYKYP